MSLKKIKWSPFISILVFYLVSFFLLNFYYDEIRGAIKKEVYYFVYTSIEYFMLAFILGKFIENKKMRTTIVVLSIAFLGFLIIYYSLSAIHRIDSIPIGVETILLFIYILFFFHQYFKKMNSDLYENAAFWFVIGILIYLAVTFFFNILANIMESEYFNKYFFYSFSGDILKNILFSIAIFQYSRHRHLADSKGSSSKIPYLDMI